MSADRNQRPAREIRPSEARMVLVAVFFTFAPIGLLIQLVQPVPGDWRQAVAAALVAGAISTAWAATFIFRRFWWLAIIIPLQAFGPWILFVLLARNGLIGRAGPDAVAGHRTLYAILILASIVVGYILMVRFARGMERQTERYRAELDIAARIHRALVPEIALRAGPIEVLGTSAPSRSMGGDLIDAVVRGGEVDVLLADVSGHGVGAGIVMGMVKSSARTLLRSSPPVDRLLTDLNVVLAELTRPEMFATMAIIRVGPDGRGEYGLAGHLPIYHYRAATGEVTELPNEHLPLGVEAEEVFCSGEVLVAPGDTLVVFTDGLMEVRNAAGRELGLAAIREVVRSRGGGTLEELRDAILGIARGHGAQADDQSVLLVRLRA
ncbi:MAG: serine/threonine-protein phosphatase [Phycisphaerales bacterium]|nr:serine/threonine-protein phosphatase [Phycisphaerales bacterium]